MNEFQMFPNPSLAAAIYAAFTAVLKTNDRPVNFDDYQSVHAMVNDVFIKLRQKETNPPAINHKALLRTTISTAKTMEKLMTGQSVQFTPLTQDTNATNHPPPAVLLLQPQNENPNPTIQDNGLQATSTAADPPVNRNKDNIKKQKGRLNLNDFTAAAIIQKRTSSSQMISEQSKRANNGHVAQQDRQTPQPPRQISPRNPKQNVAGIDLTDDNGNNNEEDNIEDDAEDEDSDLPPLSNNDFEPEEM